MGVAPVVKDLGTFSEELVLFGGVYSNSHAIKALIADIDARPALCTGDICAYGGDPAGSVAAIRAEAYPVIAGNCERQIAAGAQDCGCGFADGSACDVASGAWFAHASASIGPDDRTWMAGLPDFGVFDHSGRRFAVLHGGATAISRFIWPSDDASVFREEIGRLNQIMGHVDGVIAGHSGIAFQREIDGVHWINVGAIGLPPHDGRPETRYAILSDDGVMFRRLSYDYRSASEAMTAVGLTQGYETALETGIWPSEDMLPQALCR